MSAQFEIPLRDELPSTPEALASAPQYSQTELDMRASADNLSACSYSLMTLIQTNNQYMVNSDRLVDPSTGKVVADVQFSFYKNSKDKGDCVFVGKNMKRDGYLIYNFDHGVTIKCEPSSERNNPINVTMKLDDGSENYIGSIEAYKYTPTILSSDNVDSFYLRAPPTTTSLDRQSSEILWSGYTVGFSSGNYMVVNKEKRFELRQVNNDDDGNWYTWDDTYMSILSDHPHLMTLNDSGYCQFSNDGRLDMNKRAGVHLKILMMCAVMCQKMGFKAADVIESGKVQV